MMVNVLNLFRQIVDLSPHLPPELIQMARNVDKPGPLADMIVSTLNLDRNKKQEILETLDVKERLSKLMLFLNEELELQKMGKEIQDILEFLAEQVGDVPILVIIGNAESRGPYGRALRNLGKKRVNIVNLNVVRVFNGDDFSVVSLPGYYDRRFVEGRASCVYRKRHVEELPGFLKDATGPVVLVSHGPPRTKAGKRGIDATPDGKNVGDPEMTRIIKSEGIRFGAFSHILESGGRGFSFIRNRPVRPGRWSKDLFVNAGAVNALDWNMNGGWVSQGLGLIMRIDKGKRAKFEVIKLKRKEIPEDEYEDDF